MVNLRHSKAVDWWALGMNWPSACMCLSLHSHLHTLILCDRNIDWDKLYNREIEAPYVSGANTVRGRGRRGRHWRHSRGGHHRGHRQIGSNAQAVYSYSYAQKSVEDNILFTHLDTEQRLVVCSEMHKKECTDKAFSINQGEEVISMICLFFLI